MFLRPRHSIPGSGEQRPIFERPRFNSQVTSDRLEEGSRFAAIVTSGKIRKGRKSVFREVGLEIDGEDTEGLASRRSCEEHFSATSRRLSQSAPPTYEGGSSAGKKSTQEKSGWLSKLVPDKRPQVQSAITTPPPSIAGIHKFTIIALLIVVVLPAIGYKNGRHKVEVSGADAGVIREPIRWAGQSAVLNGTLFYYGGRAKTSANQTDNTWNNDFITVDLTKSWDVSSPSVSGMPRPSGPPAVSLGYLWNDFDHLFLYGGEFDFPSSEPSPVSTWMYDIASSTWTELKDPKTSAGQYADAGGASVQRAAEGAGVSVPELGLSWYFGGHLDWGTTPGWSNQIPRVYLKSLLEFTHPGYSNIQIDSLRNSGAPDGGAYRNITWAGEQNQNGFTERADGVLVYVPGWGPGGILLGLGGGVVGDHETTDAFSSMTMIDVYDIASSQWYHQETSGDDKPRVRVNPCAVVFSAPDASSFNIYMYGGQNLLPVGEQKQYSDVWILTVPSFTWIKVNEPQNEPQARAGHSCEARDGQIVVVGGYIEEETQCERPGVYVFDASRLVWQSSFNAADNSADNNAANSVLAGSYGYRVPDIVQSVIGGSSEGGATATQPASGPATDGPFKTGVPPVFTVTATGSTATVTNTGGGNADPPDSGGNDRRGGTIAAGVIAGFAGLLAFYLGFCAWLWRRQVSAYKKHMAIANSYGEEVDFGYDGAVAAAATTNNEKLHKKDPNTGGSSSGSGANDDDRENFAWIGQLHPGEPKFISSSGDLSPVSGTGSGRGGWPRPSEDRGSLVLNGGGGAGGRAVSGGVSRAKSNATRSTMSGGSAG
ncbi:hypothetical protein NUW58_g60 [Xylaria curta]|uniref:Uncharacterized protein n=1 Tax=Xylaria curta TaxID=42375 RepID=A0ACC1PTY6_9PEZI|nr:hypothetical protein NUW58_g60 [Xylaria curta]